MLENATWREVTNLPRPQRVNLLIWQHMEEFLAQSYIFAYVYVHLKHLRRGCVKIVADQIITA